MKFVIGKFIKFAGTFQLAKLVGQSGTVYMKTNIPVYAHLDRVTQNVYLNEK